VIRKEKNLNPAGEEREKKKKKKKEEDREKLGISRTQRRTGYQKRTVKEFDTPGFVGGSKSEELNKERLGKKTQGTAFAQWRRRKGLTRKRAPDEKQHAGTRCKHAPKYTMGSVRKGKHQTPPKIV